MSVAARGCYKSLYFTSFSYTAHNSNSQQLRPRELRVRVLQNHMHPLHSALISP